MRGRRLRETAAHASDGPERCDLICSRAERADACLPCRQSVCSRGRRKDGGSLCAQESCVQRKDRLWSAACEMLRVVGWRTAGVGLECARRDGTRVCLGVGGGMAGGGDLLQGCVVGGRKTAEGWLGCV